MNYDLFPGWGIRVGTGEAVKGDPGKGTAFRKTHTREVPVKTFFVKNVFPLLLNFQKLFFEELGTIQPLSLGRSFLLQ